MAGIPLRPATRPLVKTPQDRIFSVVIYTVFGLFALICAYPFYYLIINSISSNNLSALGDVRFIPLGFHLSNYPAVFQLPGLGLAAAVSVARTVLGTLGT